MTIVNPFTCCFPSRRTAAIMPFKYTPLDHNAPVIRVLSLLPGLFDSKPRIVVSQHSFTKETALEFEALSYSWGSSENPIDILIRNDTDPEDDFFTLSVTRNLGEALPYLRYEDQPRLIWIDAICVNQADMDERSSQVKRMADIYSKASEVVIWLGPQSDDNSTAMDCIEEAAGKVHVNWTTNVIKAPSTHKDWGDRTVSLPFSNTQMLAINNFIRRPWFRRLWVWQEVWLAPSAIIMCGFRTVPWEFIRTTVDLLWVKPTTRELYDIFRKGQNLECTYQLCRQANNKSIEELCYLTRSCQCTDPRDRIFGLLSIVHRSDRDIQIEPNYNMATSDVYKDAALRCIGQKRSLDILEMADHNISASWCGKKIYWDCLNTSPSWVPNWSILQSTEPFFNNSILNSSGSSLSSIVSRGNVLQVSGIQIGIIQSAEATGLDELNLWRDVAEMMVKAVSKLYPEEEFVEKSQLLRSLCQVLCGGDFSHTSHPPSEAHPDLAQSEEVLHNLLHDLDSITGLEEISSDARKFLNGVGHYSKHRSLFRTEQYVGLGPKITQPGDIVAIFLGCKSAMIIRPSAGKKFHLVGAAVCDGFMHGEALLGPLPSDFAPISMHNSEKQRHYPGYMHKKTRSFQPEDPRLENVPWPVGWRKQRHRWDRYVIRFLDDATGDTLLSSFRQDPRMTAEALKERGVNIQTFDLI